MDKESLSVLFLEFLDRVIQGNDSLGVFRKLSREERMAKVFIVTPEQKKEMDICGAIDRKSREKIHMFFQAIAFAVEQQSKRMVNFIIDLNEEGVGRVILYSGSIILMNKSIRSVQKYSFTKIEHLEKEGVRQLSNIFTFLQDHQPLLSFINE